MTHIPASGARRRMALAALLLLGLAACDAREAAAPGTAPRAAWDRWPGQWLVVNFWAEWCGPCRDEVPELNRLDSLRDDVTVVGINFDRPPEPEMRRQAEALGIEFPLLVDVGAEAVGVAVPEVLPTTYVLSPERRVVARLRGPQHLEDLTAALTAAQAPTGTD